MCQELCTELRPQAPLETRPERAAVHRRLCTRVRPVMGTWVAIEAEAGSEACALSAVNAAFAAFHVAERCMHPGRDGNDLQRIGRARAGEP
jgi:hypothetical protein